MLCSKISMPLADSSYQIIRETYHFDNPLKFDSVHTRLTLKKNALNGLILKYSMNRRFWDDGGFQRIPMF